MRKPELLVSLVLAVEACAGALPPNPPAVDFLAVLGDAGQMRYPGGKNGPGTYQRIINLMPPHRVYMEPFLGSGAILRLKKPAAVNIGLDLDPHAVSVFLVNTSCPSGLVPLVESPAAPAPRVMVGDGIQFLETYKFRGDELVYCDPPYLHSTRTWEGLDQYQGHEMTDVDHRRLLRVLRKLKCMALVSGYSTQMYDTALDGWSCLKFTVYTRQNNPREECVWYNFPTPTALHDYSFLGSDFRERERIKRKKKRWSARLARLDHMERQALLAVLEAEWFAGSAHAVSGVARGSEKGAAHVRPA